MVRLASDGQSHRFVNLSPHGVTRGRIGFIRDMRLRFGELRSPQYLLKHDEVNIETYHHSSYKSDGFEALIKDMERLLIVGCVVVTAMVALMR